MFFPIRRQNQIASYRTGFKDKELSMQYANREVFKKFAQRLYDEPEKEGMCHRLLHITTQDAIFWYC